MRDSLQSDVLAFIAAERLPAYSDCGNAFA